MRLIPSTSEGVPLEPINPPMPTIFTAEGLWLFESWEEYSKWCTDNYPPIVPEITNEQIQDSYEYTTD